MEPRRHVASAVYVQSLLGHRKKSVDDTDEVLIVRVREGDRNAYGELYRRYQRAAASTARSITGSRREVDDIVAEAFASVLAAIDRGAGPRDNFRHYLLACVRNGSRRRHRAVPVGPDDPSLARASVTGSVALEDPERYVVADTVARAFADLPVRWQQVLWATAVEQKSSAELCTEFGVSPNAVAALTYRAREAFAAAYLGVHATVRHEQACQTVGRQLAKFVRGAVPDGVARDVRLHLDACAACRQAAEELGDINTSLRSLLPTPAAAQLMERTRRLAAPLSSTGGAAFSGTLVAGVAAGALCVVAVLLVAVHRFGGTDGAPDPRVVIEGTLPSGSSTTLPAFDRQRVDELAPAEQPDDVPPAVADQPARTDPPAGADGAGDLPAVDDVEVVQAPEVVVAGGGLPGGSVPAGGAAGPGGAGAPDAGSGGGGGGGGGGTSSAGSLPSGPAGADEPDAPGRLLAWLGVDDLVRPLGAEPLVGVVDELVWEATSEAVAPTVGRLWGAASDLIARVPVPLPADSFAAPLLRLLASIPGAPLVMLPDDPAAVNTRSDVDVLPRPGATLPFPVGVPRVPTSVVSPTTSGRPSPSPTPAPPLVSLPRVTIPQVTVAPRPAVTAPPVTLPPLPQVTLPPVTLPQVTLPPLPQVTLPPVTLPPLPQVTLPPVTLPPLPQVTLPQVTLPPVTLPPVTVPVLPQVIVPAVTLPTVPPPAATVSTTAATTTAPAGVCVLGLVCLG